jgi:hypothetical protein
MSDTSQRNPATKPNKSSDSGRANLVKLYGWQAGFPATFAFVVTIDKHTWPVAIGVAAIAVIVSFVVSTILTKGVK